MGRLGEQVGPGYGQLTGRFSIRMRTAGDGEDAHRQKSKLPKWSLYTNLQHNAMRAAAHQYNRPLEQVSEICLWDRDPLQGIEGCILPTSILYHRAGCYSNPARTFFAKCFFYGENWV